MHENDTLPVELNTDFAVIGSYPTSRRAHEAGLCVLACGQAYWIRHEDGRYLLIVASSQANRLLEEIRASERLNRFWPPRSLDLSASGASKIPSAVASLILVVIFALQIQFPEMKESGINARNALLQNGEWWRIVTATTLHANIGHLSGNLLGLAFFSYLCGRYFGNGLSWSFIVVGAALANATTAVLSNNPDYASLGASTAVFCSLGLLSGFPLGRFFRDRRSIQSRDWLVPFAGGCILFAWMGGGEFPTDVAAHLWSFLYGTLIAIAAAGLSMEKRLSKALQRTLLGATVAVVSVAWFVALA